MTDLDLAEVERMLEAATPGPWGLSQRGSVVGPQAIPHDNPTMNRMLVCDEVSAEDAAFIAAVRTLVPALVARVRELEAAQAWRPIESAPVTATDDDPWKRVRILTWGTTGIRTGDLYRGPASDGPIVHLSNVHGNAVEPGWVTHWQPLPSPPGGKP